MKKVTRELLTELQSEGLSIRHDVVSTDLLSFKGPRRDYHILETTISYEGNPVLFQYRIDTLANLGFRVLIRHDEKSIKFHDQLIPKGLATKLTEIIKNEENNT